MKTIVSLSTVLLLFVVTACTSGKKEKEIDQPTVAEPVVVEQQPTSTPVVVKELSGYFLNNTYELKSEINVILAKDKDQMALAFGKAKTMTNKVDQVDFNTDAVIGVAMQPTDHKTEISIDKVEKEGGTLNVYVAVNHGDKQSFKTTPLVLFSFTRDADIKKVELYVGKEKKDSNAQF